MSRLTQLSNALSGIINFAKPGEMFEKYGGHSPWMDSEASGMRRAVTKRKIPKGAIIYDGKAHLKEIGPGGVTSHRPVRPADMIDAAAFKREKHKLLIKTAQPELETKLKGVTSGPIRQTIKREHLAGIRKQLKQPPSETRREISNIRGSMASDLRTTRKIIGGIRDEAQRRGLPRPIGIPGSSGGHGIDRPLMIGESLPEAIKESKDKLKVIVDESIDRRQKRAVKLEGAVRKRISTGIQATRTSAGKSPHPTGILGAKTHEAMEPFLRRVPPDRAELANISGYIDRPANPDKKIPARKIPLKKIESTRKKLDELRDVTGTTKHVTAVEDKAIKSGRVFIDDAGRSPLTAAPKPKSLPALRKIGIGVGAALAGTAVASALIRSKKKKKSAEVQFARGDIYTAVKTNLIGGTKLINLPKKIKQRVSLRIAAAKGDAAGFRERSRELGSRKLQVVTHRMQTERDKAAAELRGLRIGARSVRTVKSKLDVATSEVERLTKKVNSRGARLAKLRGETVDPGDAFKDGQKYGETIGKQNATLESALERTRERAHFDDEIKRVAREKDASMKSVKKKQRKRIAIGVASGASVGGAAGYTTGRDRRKPVSMSAKIDTVELEVETLKKVRRKIEHRPEASVTAHAVTGGLEGAAGIYAIDPILEYLRHGRKAVRNPLRDTFRGHVNKIATGALVGAAATAPIGWLVEKEREKRRARRPIMFAVQSGNRAAVARDRYSKKIYADDKTRAENNYIRTALGGAAISGLLRKASGLKLRPALLAGAGAGVATQAIVRSGTSKTKDQFGDRSFKGKRIDNVPGQVGGLAVTGILAKRLVDQFRKIKKAGRVVGMHAHGPIIVFEKKERKSKWDPNSPGFNRVRRSEEGALYITRAARAAKDLRSVITGKDALDARGRPKKKEWEKSYVKTAVTAGILGATFAGVRGARKFVHEAAARDIASGHTPGGLAKLSEVIKSGAMRRAAENKIPGFRGASNFLRKTKTEVHAAASDPLGKIAERIEKAATLGPRPIKVAPAVTKTSAAGAVTHAPAGSEAAKLAERKRQQALRKKMGKIMREGGELSSKVKPIELAEYVADWDVRDPRGRSARVYAPGSTRRQRRKKRWDERVDNQRIIHQAELGGALIAGTLLAGGRRKISTAASPVMAAVEKVAPRRSTALERLLREARRM